MRRIVKEVLLLSCIVVLGGALTLGLTRVVKAQTVYDTFPGRVNKIPLQISSPTYGQVLALPLTEGQRVEPGQPLATIQVVDRNFRVPQDSQLFKLQGDTLHLISPINGVVGRIAVARLSTVAASEMLVRLYTVDDTDVQVLVPQGRGLAGYQSFYAAAADNKPRHRIRIEGAIPSDVAGNVSRNTTVYRARCETAADCWTLLNNVEVMVYAQRGPVKSGFPGLPEVPLPSFASGQ